MLAMARYETPTEEEHETASAGSESLLELEVTRPPDAICTKRTYGWG